MIKYFNEGIKAFKEGINKCPYSVESYARFFWNNGYDTAKREAMERAE